MTTVWLTVYLAGSISPYGYNQNYHSSEQLRSYKTNQFPMVDCHRIQNRMNQNKPHYKCCYFLHKPR